MDSTPLKAAFAVGTGRCGTHLIAELLGRERDVKSCHERDPLTDTFHRYCRWYRLPVDASGYIAYKRRNIESDLEQARISFEASAYVAFAVRDLIEAFDARIIHLVRHPRAVVESYLSKGAHLSQVGWYAEPFIQTDPKLALGVQRHTGFHHFLGRIAPMGDEFSSWNAMSRIGKLAWYWRTVNEHVAREAESIANARVMICRLEDLDHEKYLEIASFIGIQASLTERAFARIAKKRPGKQEKRLPAREWSQQERDEFAAQLGDAPMRFGYTL